MASVSANGSGAAPGGSSGSSLWGASSWFGGPNDPSSGPTTASGAPVTTPGIAVDDRSTLGGYWAIKIGSDIGIVQQTDIGPAPSTGRKFDYTYSLLPLFGFTQANFPTGAQTYGIYLGKSITQASTNLETALTSLGATTAQNQSFTTAIDAGPLGKGKASAYVVNANGQNAAASSAGPVSTSPTGDATPAGVNISNPISDVSTALTDAFNTAVGDAKYAAVLIVVLVAAAVLMTRAFSGGGGGRPTVVPVPV